MPYSTLTTLPSTRSRRRRCLALAAVTTLACASLSAGPFDLSASATQGEQRGAEPQRWSRIAGTSRLEVELEDRHCAGDATVLRRAVFTGRARVDDPRLDGTTMRLEFTSHINRFLTSGDPAVVADFDGKLSFLGPDGDVVASGETFGALEELRVRAAARLRFADGNTAVLTYSGVPYSANRGAYAFEFGSEVPLVAKSVSVASTGGPCRPGEVVYSGRSAFGAATPAGLPEVDPPDVG